MASLLESLNGLSPTQREAALVLLRKKGIDPYRESPIPLADRGARLPLSFAQQRLWFLWKLDPSSPAYNIPSIVHLRGKLDREALARALDAVIARHEALRTTFEEADGHAWQRIAEPAPTPLRVVPDSGWLDEASAARLAREEAQTPFDLQAGPLIRARLLALAPDCHHLLLTVHHSIADGWSLALLPRELGELYSHHAEGAPLTLPVLPIHYADYACWQRDWMASGETARQLRYWAEQLSGDVPPLALPSDRPRRADHGDRGSQHRFSLDENLTARIKAFARARGATLAMFLLAAFNAVLHRYTGQTDLWIGVQIGRAHV